MAGGNVGIGMVAKLKGDILSFPVKIATLILRGTPVAIDSAGYLIEAADSAAMKFVGIAEEGCTVADAVADGTISLRVRRHGIFRMTKNTTSAVTDVGKLAYAHTAQTASVDALVALAAVTTYDNAVGLIVRREPDEPGGAAFTKNYLMVDITPSPWSAADITTHAALADQTAHTEDGIAPVVDTEAGASPTITVAEFIGRTVLCSAAGASAVTLPTAAGITAGTICRFIKTGSVGAFTVAGGTLVGQQCASNVFYGCSNIGDSVDVQAVGTNSFRIVNVSQQVIETTYSGDDPTVTAAAFLGGLVTLSQAGATSTATTLPASGVPVGTRCRFRKTGSAGSVKLTATALVGAGTTANVVTTCDAQYDVCVVECIGDDDYQVVSRNEA